MKAALLIVLSLSALAFAGPAVKPNNNNQIDASIDKYMGAIGDNIIKQTPATETLKQWCFSSQMSQTELTASFKKLVGIVKSSPEDKSTEIAVMSERICQSAAETMPKSTDATAATTKPEVDVKAHELIKDVYMDALIACESRECMKQLIKIIDSNKVDSIRASYYMTRVAVSEKSSVKDEQQVKELAESFIQQQQDNTGSEAIERQKLFAVTAVLGKSLEGTTKKDASVDMQQTAEKVAKTIVERYMEPISAEEVEQYKKQSVAREQPSSSQVAKKIAKRSAALKALANLPSSVLKEIKQVQEILIELAMNKSELSTVRQSAIECLKQNEQVYEQLKQLAYDQSEPIEVRVAAYRTIMTLAFAGEHKDEQEKQQMAKEIVGQVVKHCEQEQSQQQDDQFCLYAISHLDNVRSSQQPEHAAIKECIAKNKQHYMQIQLLVKKFKHQLADVRKSSRNYKLEQEFNQINSGLVIEGDIVYESAKKTMMSGKAILPKLVRVNMSMPITGETVNVVEITVRQNAMDEELLGALKLVQGAKFSSETMTKMVDSFKSSVENKKQQGEEIAKKQEQSAEADMTIKVDGATVVYLCLDDFKSEPIVGKQHERKTRSAASIVDEIIEYLKREPVAFNRGFNFNINKSLGKGMLDIEANLIAGLRFESRASGQSADNFEIVAQIEPRFAFESVVGPASTKMSAKKLLQRVSTKTALGLRLRFKQNELLDVEIELPMNTMELFTVESQMVEKSGDSYAYLPESVYGQTDIYSTDELVAEPATSIYRQQQQLKRAAIFGNQSGSNKSLVKSWMSSASSQQRAFAGFAHSVETSESVARATGLRGKLRVVASAQDMSFLAQCVAQKFEPEMRGYRVQIQKQAGGQQGAYQLTVSTPGARVERTMQARFALQASAQRTLVKGEIESPMMQALAAYELVHDGRQFALKAEMASQRGQWRHAFEAGVQRGSQSQSGRIATTYKPYLSVESSELKRPVQMQGVVSYQHAPKTVISYELKSANAPSDFVQGKIILAERQTGSGSQFAQRAARSMRSPVELLLSSELTVTSEFLAQLSQHAVKVHQMIEWDAAKWALQADVSGSHKNLRKQGAPATTVTGQLKLDQQQQMLTVQRVSPQKPHQQYRFTIASDTKQQQSHQLLVELRYNGKRAAIQQQQQQQPGDLKSVVAYKHKVEFQKPSAGQAQIGYVIELIASEHQIAEKLQGRTELAFEPRMKTIKSIKAEMQSRQKFAKLAADFASAEQQQVELALQSERASHRSSWRADKRQVQVQSRTELRGQTVNKLQVSIQKATAECQIMVEQPRANLRLVADLKLQPGRASSVAFSSQRFSSKAEFAFEPATGAKVHSWARHWVAAAFPAKLHLKSELKDAATQEAYWLDAGAADKAYFRFDSPVYRTDLEFDPRDSSAKFGMFARAKRHAGVPFAGDDSLISELNAGSKLSVGATKAWMVRSLLSGSPIEQLEKRARRALFEYADRRQEHKHSFEWQPSAERVQLAFERQPSAEFAGAGTGSFKQVSPVRFSADLATSFEQQQQQPSRVSMDSQFVEFDALAKPFDGQDSYYSVKALSRHPRAAFKKHESEFRYSKQHGYKAAMKHQDKQGQRHQWQLEADQAPQKWAKMSYDSERHGKGQYEHQWRKHVGKRSPAAKRSAFAKQQQQQQQVEQEDVYKNQIAFESQSPKQEWSHRSQLAWDEPIRMVERRPRRDTRHANSVLEYLKHTSARMQSATSTGSQIGKPAEYQLDFDYQPLEQYARLNIETPDEMQHATQIDFAPSERLYKLQSSLTNRRTNEPSYQLMAATSKPIETDAATFFQQQHPMIERPLAAGAGIFKQPLKLDYSDKFGRAARLDYDEIAATAGAEFAAKYAGLRPKRAALFFKDAAADFQHQSTHDFYPEAVAGFEPSKRAQGDLVWKSHTKYGPVEIRAESSEQTVELVLASPLVSAKLTGESPAAGAQLVKLSLDNQQQSVQLAKLVRKIPILAECPWAHQLAKQIDAARFEHTTELLVALAQTGAIKIKSSTEADKRQLMTIDGELSTRASKLALKIQGERIVGQLMVDLAGQSASLAFDVDNKRTMAHQARLVRNPSGDFFTLDALTSYHQKPLLKLSAKISAMIFAEPGHLFASRRQVAAASAEEHVSQFEAVVFEPSKVQVSGAFDCLKKEARVFVRDERANKQSAVRVQFDEQAQQVYLTARTTGPKSGMNYSINKAFNVAPLIQAY